MRILIIGGTRFVGPCLVQRLVSEGHQVILFHRGRTQAALPTGVREILGDRNELRVHGEILRRLEPDAVIDMFLVNGRHAGELMSLFRGQARRVVAISSMDVYRAYGRLIGSELGPVEPTPLTEESPLRERLYPYRTDSPPAQGAPTRWQDEYDKIPVEQAVLGDSDLPGTVLRLPMVYGPGDYQHRLFPYLKRMDDGRPAILLGELQARWRGCRGHVENVAHAIVLASTDDRAAGKVYNVADAYDLSEAEWVRAIGRAAGWQGEVVTVPGDRLPQGWAGENWAQHLSADTSRIRRELGYLEPVPLEDGLLHTVQWERAHPPDPEHAPLMDYAAEDAILARLG